jgi:hypothetical protein
VQGTTYSAQQQVLYMEAHGDNYTGIVPGLGVTAKPNNKLDSNCYQPSTSTFTKGTGKVCPDTTDIPLPQCTNYEELPSTTPGYNKRVGGVACTRDQYGPGVYNLLCYVPQTEDTATDGRGYVFAIWPFHYEEMYSGKLGDPHPPQYVDDTKLPCFNECDGGTASVPCPSVGVAGVGGNCGTGVDDLFSAINHEIDIEIPANSPQFDWKTQMTWGTMNCNTWNNDINYYGTDTGAYYTQVAVPHPTPNGKFISALPESNTSKDYHWYTMDWHVDPDNIANNYVAFYFDDPFDPSGTVTLNSGSSTLPVKSKNPPIFKTNRFIPTRSGRLNFGPWMAWWGYNAKNGGVPNFDTAKIRLAQLSITPQQDLWGDSTTQSYKLYDFPQSYDQPGTLCDFKDLLPPGPATVVPTPVNPGFPVWAIVVIILAVIILALIIWAIVDAVKKKKKKL